MPGIAVFPLRAAVLLSLAASFSVAQAQGLRITTGSALPPGVVGGTYLQALTATGGVPPYLWGVSSGILPAGLALLPNGSISGVPSAEASATLTIQAADSAGARVSQTVSITVIAAGTYARAGVLAQIAAGGTWNTVITLVNSSPQPVAVRVNFYLDDGSPWSLPLAVTQHGSTQPAPASPVLDGVLSPNTALQIATGALPATVTGWAEVLSPGPVGGYAIFRTTPASGPASEGTAPLQVQSPSSVVLSYDNTTGYVMGVAFANASPAPTEITATIWDETGAMLGTQAIVLPGRGHSALVMPSQIPLTAGKRGIVRFVGSGTGGIATLGLRFSPFATFTSVPAQ